MNEQFNEFNNANPQKKKSALSSAGLVLGIIGVCVSFIPLMYYVSFALGALALIFGAISLAKKRSVGKSVAALVLGILAVVFSVMMISAVDDAIEEIDEELSYMDGSQTENILKNYLNVSIGSFEVTSDEFFDDTKLTVTVKNIADEKKSYSIEIEAIDSEGNRIDTDYIYANDLASGQSQTFTVFTLVSSDKIASMKNATFRIVEVSMY